MLGIYGREFRDVTKESTSDPEFVTVPLLFVLVGLPLFFGARNAKIVEAAFIVRKQCKAVQIPTTYSGRCLLKPLDVSAMPEAITPIHESAVTRSLIETLNRVLVRPFARFIMPRRRHRTRDAVAMKNSANANPMTR